jgi:hypothetical protein
VACGGPQCGCGGHLSSAGAERRAHRGEAPGALVARTAMAHRGAEPDRRAPRRLSRSRRRKIRFAAIQRIDRC